MYNPQLYVFIQVADKGSFSKAAEALFLSTTAIMNQMNQLEKQIGLKLFDRTPRGVQLTKAGKSLYKDAMFMIQYSKDCISRAYQAQSESHHQIRVCSSFLHPSNNLMDLWNRISSDYPMFSLRVIPFEDNTIPQHEVGKRFDIFTGVYNSTIARDICQFLQLGTYQFKLAISKLHPLSSKKLIGMSDLHGETLVMLKPGISPINDQIRSDIKKEHPQIRLVDADSYNIDLFNISMENNHILLSFKCWENIHPSLATVSFDIPYRIPYGIVYSVNPDKQTKEFIKIVSSTL